MLLISVFQGTAGELRSLGVAGHINYQYRRDGKVSDMAGSSASLKLLGSTSHHANQATQQLRVVDGGEGYIETGESLPMVFHGYRGRFGSQGASITYRDSLSGFYVRPRLRGEWVNLDISPHWEQTSQVLGGAFETASASTSIRGPLGQWLPIGGVGQQRHNNLVDMTSIMTTGEQQDRQMWIKVERVE
jgi:hypothetical protein